MPEQPRDQSDEPSSTPLPSGWRLIWSDEFASATGTAPDERTWTPVIGGDGWDNQELQYYTNTTNATQDGKSNLVIEARTENPANAHCWYGPCHYTSARLITKGKFEFTYGRVEVRAKLPSGQGIWPAIWMLGHDIDTVGWPTTGEIDICEHVGREPATIHATIHGPNYSYPNGISGAYSLAKGRFADAYHRFAVEWNTDWIAFFLDGSNYFTVTRATVEQRGKWVYDHPFYLLLNVAVGGSWPGNPDARSIYPQQMLVDYVRVYQQHEGSTNTRRPPS